jgi:nitrogen fixation protein NifQ
MPQRAQPIPTAVALSRQSARQDEVDEVASLLLEHAPCTRQARAMAHILAVACLGDNHLWQDLQLSSRAELSSLMGHWFPALVARNHQDMKWKKFLYKQLCEREQLFICKAPSCAVCSDFNHCFGPES